MSTLLFSIHLSRHVKGFGKPCVHAREAGLVGHYADGKPYKPDHNAVRDALPHYYRAAFDRAAPWAFDARDNDKPASVTLYGSRGRYLNTVYAQPYQFTVGA